MKLNKKKKLQTSWKLAELGYFIIFPFEKKKLTVNPIFYNKNISAFLGLSKKKGIAIEGDVNQRIQVGQPIPISGKRLSCYIRIPKVYNLTVKWY